MTDETFYSIDQIKDALQLGEIKYEGSNATDISAALENAKCRLSDDELNDYVGVIEKFVKQKKNHSMIAAWIVSIPYVDDFKSKLNHDSVTKLIGETVFELSHSLSSERLSQFLLSLPKIAKQLDTTDAFQSYLLLIEQLALKAPRHMKTIIENTPHLLETVPMSGLRYWALFGANAHAHNDDALHAYFSLTSAESQTVLQQQRKGMLFSHIQRQLQFFLRAIWGEDFFMRPLCLPVIELNMSDASEGQCSPRLCKPIPTIEDGVILLPDAIDGSSLINGERESKAKNATEKRLYRAMATHCASHLRYSRPRLRDPFTELERVCIELFEDARVEAYAIKTFPGMKTLWRSFHDIDAHGSVVQNRSNNALSLLNNIAIALLDMKVSGANAHPLVTASLNKFSDNTSSAIIPNGTAYPLDVSINKDDEHATIEKLGTWLASALEADEEFTASIPGLINTLSIKPLVIYRDDNQTLWRQHASDIIHWEIQHHRQVKRTVSVTEMVNEIDCELADENAQEIWILESEFFRDGDPENVSMNEQEAKAKISPPFVYHEWDYAVNAHRPAWVTLTERRVPMGNPDLIDSIIAKRQTMVKKIKALVEALQPQGLVRLRKQFEGDSLDLDAAIEAMKELRRGALPEMNIDQRLKRQERDLAVLVLLDLSQSTLDAIPNDIENRSILNVAQEATVMLASALDGIGDAFAIHGFSSNGRHDVQYQRVKDFDHAYDDDVKSRLAGIQGGLSTRMGAALRHAKTFLAQQPQRKKLLLVVSDGEPADIDVRDPLYLQADTRRAVEELCLQGVIPYCLTIDPDADNYVCQVFGQGHYTVVDRVTQLPDVLPSLFASLTKRAG
ncbi:nitric oxide reductase activation protein NorD [Enterovibrio sp. 27052020O]|uniref:nitric oxide reductase activation protein NorD n=1 Tax=Enterovibrio sp. 27052020O TaxID=3241166 RepID=UPI00388D624C